MNVKAYLKIKVIDQNGKCTYYRRYRSRSFVIGFLNDIFSGLSKQGIPNKNTAGTQYTVSYTDGMIVNAGSNNGNYGIVIGLGTSAPTIIDYSLSILIQNGTSVNQMQYGAVSITGAVTDKSTNTGYITVTRTFTNNSGSSITVSEVGIVAWSGSSTIQTNQYYLIVHDLLPSPITVPNGSSLSISYEIQVAT